MTQPYLSKVVISWGLLALLCLTWPLVGQAQSPAKPGSTAEPTITITEVPRAGGGEGRMEPIAGTVQGTDVTRSRVVLFSYTDRWYVQPFVAAPFTDIKPDGTWTSRIHLGTEYTAVLVDASYKAPATTFTLPKLGEGVLAITRVPAK
jgi:hypothetical protein